LGPWRVVDLPKPLTLGAGFYILGGWDTSATKDVILYVPAGGGTQGSGSPGYQDLAPPGSPVVIGPCFSAYGIPGIKFELPTRYYYMSWGLFLGPMLFGTKEATISTGSGLSIFPLALAPAVAAPGRRPLDPPPPPPPHVLTWPTGTLLQADAVT